MGKDRAHGGIAASRWKTLGGKLLPWLAGTWFALLVLAAIFVIWRRLTGALSGAPSTATLLPAALWIAGGAAAVRWAWRPRARLARRDFAGMGVTSTAVLILALALSVPGSDAGGLVLFWALLLGEEIGAWLVFFRHRCRGTNAAIVRRAADGQTQTLLQQLELRQAVDGTRELAGWLRLPLAAGQRSGNVHVAFCPPFDGLPEVELQLAEGPSARVKPAQILPYGARVEVKLSAPATTATSVLLRFSARK